MIRHYIIAHNSRSRNIYVSLFANQCKFLKNIQHIQLGYRLHNMAKILIVTDSRGTGLQEEIKNIMQKDRGSAPTVKIEVAVLRGANLDNGCDRLEHEIDMNQWFDLIYVMLGVNNLSKKNSNGRIEPIFEDVPTLIEIMLAKFEIFKCQLSTMSNKVVLCQMIGMNISLYNKMPPVYDVYQQVINESMPILAHTLNLVNADDNTIGPWLTKIVHYWVNHKQYNAYGKLSDGVHYSKQTKHVVAKRIVESILKNIH